MSRIYFHTPERTVEVRGSERAYMGVLAADVALGVLKLRTADREWIENIAPGFTWREGDYWLSDFETWFRVGWEECGLIVGGRPLGCTDLALNTLIAMRSPALALLGHLHGWCEDHAWVAQEDAEWFAGVVEAGRESNILRPEQGWEAVAELAREVASGLPGPIVTSYSVCEGFPNASVAQYDVPLDDEGEQDWDAWYDLPEAERWRMGIAGLTDRQWIRQISPATEYDGFLSGASAFDLMAERWAYRSKPASGETE